MTIKTLLARQGGLIAITLTTAAYGFLAVMERTAVYESWRPALLGAFVLANLGIVGGYIYTGLRIAPHVRAHSLRVRIGGPLFFITCAATHLELAAHAALSQSLDFAAFTSSHMLPIHFLQVISVWWFIGGLYEEYIRPQIEITSLLGLPKDDMEKVVRLASDDVKEMLRGALCDD